MSGSNQLIITGDELVLFAPLSKINIERQEVYGYASTPRRDKAGEIITLDAVKAALADYLEYPAVREMHQPKAVGSGIEAKIDSHGLWFGAHIQDPETWRKCLPTKLPDGTEHPPTLKGFSIGGRITARDDNDKSIVKAIELVEISVVDRPCNPDARFQMVKLDHGSMAMSEPLAKFWVCDEAFDKAGHRLDSGAFATRAKAQRELLDHAARHEDSADEADQSASRHRRRQTEAESTANPAGVTIHGHLADTNATLAEHHRTAARRYRDLAASLAPGAATEDSMTTKNQLLSGASDDIMAEAAAAMQALGKAMESSTLEGLAADHMASVQEAHTRAKEEDAKAIAAVAAATQARATANAKRADGDKNQAKHHDAEAQAQENAAAAHHEMAQSYHELVTQHITQMAGASAHGANEDHTSQPTGNLGKAEADARMTMCKAMCDHCTDHAEKCMKSAGDYDGFAKTAGEQDRGDMAGAHTLFGNSLKKVADDRTGTAKSINDVLLTGFKDMATPTAKVAVKPLAKLNKSTDGMWLDKKGRFFGKRDFSDDKRQDLADKGHAMPDGSFPIENKEDLENAVTEHGRAKDPEKAKAHIVKQAKRLGHTDALPEDWEGSTKKKTEATTKTDPPAVTTKVEDADDDDDEDDEDIGNDDDDETKAAKTARNLLRAAQRTAKTAKAQKRAAKAALAKVEADKIAKAGGSGMMCQACNKAVGADDETCPHCSAKIAKAAAVVPAVVRPKVAKSMSFVSSLASTMVGVRELLNTYGKEQAAEGDTGNGASTTMAALRDWLMSGVKLLETVVVEEVAEYVAGKDVERIWNDNGVSWGMEYVRASAPSVWMNATAALLRANAEKPVPKETRKLRKTIAAAMEKAAPMMDGLVVPAAKPDPNGSGSGKNTPVPAGDDAMKTALKTMVSQIAPMVKAMQDLRGEVVKGNVEREALAARLARVEGEPITALLPRGKLQKNAVGKEGDGPDNTGAGTVVELMPTKSKLLRKIEEIPAGPERSAAMLRLGYAGHDN